MKKFAYTCLVAGLMLTGCTGFLNVENLGKNTIEGFFADIEGITTAGVGLHRTMLEFYDDDYLRFADLAGDKTNIVVVNASVALKKIFDFDNLAEDVAGYPYNIWNDGYEICTNANNILFYGEGLKKRYPKQADLIETNYGYAYFARALAIFSLCNVYAMPYNFTPDASHLGVVPINFVPGFDDVLARKSIKDCYDQVISDLEKGIACLEGRGKDDRTYVSADACRALLARVYLYKGDYEKAAEYAQMMIDRYPLTPREQYVNMFRRAQEVTGSETILRFNTYDAGTGMTSMSNPLGTMDWVPTPEFLASFAPSDVRRQLFTFVGEPEDHEFEGASYTAVCKYIPLKGGVSDENNRRSDHFCLRASEMYFIHAEALCALGRTDEAAEDVKAIIARAYGIDKSAVTLSYSGKADLDRLIQDEKAKELCFEGHRFFDLKRRGENVVRPASTNSALKELIYPDFHYALPVSQTEMQANDYMIQNEGYTGRKSLDEE